ncbi:MAG: glycerophosphodiester phosphodiesterase [Actinomycetota bacterium]
MNRRTVVLGPLLGLLVLAPATSANADSRGGNPWLDRRVLNMAHQGGEIEAPSDTMFAFKTAAAKGADVLELDVHATSDREIVVLHDATVDRTTDGSGAVDEMTLEEIQKLDAAHWFVPGCGTCLDEPKSAYAYRGFATGKRPIPKRLGEFAPSDFTIPTLREVFETFPDMLINVEIKATAPETMPYEQELAALLAEFNRTTDTIVVSFMDQSIELFKIFAPDVHTATATVETALFYVSTQGPLPGAPNPRYVALQVPIEFMGITVVTPEFIESAHANDLAVHVWTIDDRRTMKRLIRWGVDGIMTNRPTLLERILRTQDLLYRSS